MHSFQCGKPQSLSFFFKFIDPEIPLVLEFGNVFTKHQFIFFLVLLMFYNKVVITTFILIGFITIAAKRFAVLKCT